MSFWILPPNALKLSGHTFQFEKVFNDPWFWTHGHIYQQGYQRCLLY